MGGWRPKSWDQFATFTLPYITIPMLPRRDSPPPLVFWMTFCLTQLRIHCAASLAITQTLRLTSTMSPPPQPFPPLFCIMTRHRSQLPFPALLVHLPRSYSPLIVSMKTSHMCCRSTTIYLSRCPRNPRIRQQLKASTFLPLHRIQSSQVYQCSIPLPKLPHPPLLFPLPPHPPPLPSSTTQTSRRLPIHQTSRLQLLLIEFSTIYLLQVRRCLHAHHSSRPLTVLPRASSLDNSYYC